MHIAVLTFVLMLCQFIWTFHLISVSLFFKLVGYLQQNIPTMGPHMEKKCVHMLKCYFFFNC